MPFCDDNRPEIIKAIQLSLSIYHQEGHNHFWLQPPQYFSINS